MTDFASAAEDAAPDPAVAQRRAADPETSAWVAASAGSGKTKVLTDRLLRLLLAGTQPPRILALTFTKAAAAEMANRLSRRLAGWATMAESALVHDELHPLLGRAPTAAEVAEARRLFARVLEAPGGLKIQTIHAFCQAILRRFPLEAGIPAHFQVMDESSAAERLREARDEVLRRAETSDDDLAAALSAVVSHQNEAQFATLMQRLVAERGRFERLLARHGGLAPTIAATAEALGVARDATPEGIVQDACAEGAFDRAGLRDAAAGLAGGSKQDRTRAAAIEAFLDAGDDAARAERLADLTAQLVTQSDTVKTNLATKPIRTAQPDLVPTLEAEAERLLAVRQRWRAAVTLRATAAMLTLAAAMLEAYRSRKRAAAVLDYDDLIQQTLYLLGEATAADWVLFKLDGGLDHILVDEAQDTNPEQWAIVRHLATEFFAGSGADRPAEGAAVRTVFAVGDEKQSIYGFQRADPQAFAAMRAYFDERVRAAGQGFATVPLTVSFRAVGAVLRAVDAVFADAAVRTGVVADPATPIAHQARRLGQGGRVELWPAVPPPPQSEEAPWTPPTGRRGGSSAQARLAQTLAAQIRAWLDRGEPLPARGRAMTAGDILVLVRRRSGFVDMLVRALKARDVPVAGVDRMQLTEQLPVQDLMALARFLLLPEDDYSLACLLKSPLIGLDDDDLLRLARQAPAGRDQGRFWPALRALAEADGVGSRFERVHTWLGALLARTDFDRPYELFAGVLAAPCPGDASSGRRAFLGRLGGEAAEPLDEFLNRALAYERGHAPTLQHFLHWAEQGGAEIKRDQEAEAGTRLRVMTVHGAKGLQAPVVILPDTLRPPPDESQPIFWPAEGESDVVVWPPRAPYRCPVGEARFQRRRAERDREYRRLLYVALTRAEDRLIVAGWHMRDTPKPQSWYELCRHAWTGWMTETQMDFRPLVGEAGWDGPGLVLAEPQRDAPDERPATAAPGPAPDPAPAWLDAPPPEEPEPPRPLAPSQPVTAQPPVTPPLAGDGGARFQRGRLVHRLLQHLPDLPPAERRPAALAFLQAGARGLAPEDAAALADEVLGVLADPAAAHLFDAPALAEVPVTARLGDRAIAGQIDRLVVQPASVDIVDYKTNRPPARQLADVPATYLGQLAAYHAAVAAMYPGRQVRAWLLYTDGPVLLPVPDSALAQHVPVSAADAP